MEKIVKLNRKYLREFGLLTGTIIAVLFGLIIPWVKGHSFSFVPWMIAVIFWLLSLLTPMTLKPIYHTWMKIGAVLGWINTRLILGLIFYGIMMPMGLIMHLLKRDTMSKNFDVNLSTYRLISQPKNKTNMEKPF